MNNISSVTSITETIPCQVEEKLIGQEVRVFRDQFAPEAIGRIEKVRGFGSLQVVEIRIHDSQPGARVRVASIGKWELLRGGEI